jgi:hypothetical protein
VNDANGNVTKTANGDSDGAAETEGVQVHGGHARPEADLDTGAVAVERRDAEILHRRGAVAVEEYIVTVPSVAHDERVAELVRGPAVLQKEADAVARAFTRCEESARPGAPSWWICAIAVSITVHLLLAGPALSVSRRPCRRVSDPFWPCRPVSCLPT